MSGAIGLWAGLVAATLGGLPGSAPPAARPQLDLPVHQAWILTDTEMIPITVEVAQSPAQIALGLMFRKELPANRGMYFFLPRNDIAEFWMRNCSLSLDLVFLDKNGVITNVVASAPPCLEGPDAACPRYHSVKPATNVLEMVGGWCQARGVKAGHKVSLGDRIRATPSPKAP